MGLLGLLVIGLLVVAAVVERQLAARGLRRLTATETFANLDGARVRYRLRGKEHRRPAVLFLNGISASLEQFARIQPEVSAFAPVIAYDRAGYGFNGGGQAHSAGEQAAEIVRLLAAVGVDGPVVLLGYSNAASIARVFADRYPEKVAGILYLDPFLPEVESRVPSVHSEYRRYARSLLRENTLTLLGLKRLGPALGGGRPTQSPDEDRTEAIRGRSHWWAVTREMLATNQTHREALSARPGPPPHDRQCTRWGPGRRGVAREPGALRGAGGALDPQQLSRDRERHRARIPLRPSKDHAAHRPGAARAEPAGPLSPRGLRSRRRAREDAMGP